MEAFQSALLNVWREVCRHIELPRSTQTIARILSRHMPLDRICVTSFHFERRLIVSMAVAPVEEKAAQLPNSVELNTKDLSLLRSWLRRKEVLLHKHSETPSELIRLLVDHALDGNWLVAPLSSEQGVEGALLLFAKLPKRFETVHSDMTAALIEPFSAALENDRRLSELNTLREAAEADKRSALSRLGRDDLANTIVGGDGGLHAVMQRVALVARSDMPVLILGETGTGKEVIARSIHERSSRQKNPFIRVNCAAIPPELIDSELFGHEKGAFTGATSLRRGWFERADEGTLLLDEIGELPLAAQVRLLRVLQENMFERIGSEKTVRVNVRIVAATHRDLPAMIQQGQFREDLWYRIAGFPIVLPPLRERKRDIPALAAHFAERAARRFGLRPCQPDPFESSLLIDYHWPGNIRELASVIDRAAILGEGERLAIAQALGTPVSNQQTHTTIAARPGALQSRPLNKDETQQLVPLDQAMRQHIESALATTLGRIEGKKGAAQLLGLNPHTLRSRMRKLGIRWQRFR